MSAMIEKIDSLNLSEWSDKEKLEELHTFFCKILQDEESLTHLCLQYGLMVSTHKAEITWLDEIAEALQNCADGLNLYRIREMKLDQKTALKLESSQDVLNKLIGVYLKMICYSIGVVAYRLIQLNKDETDDRKNLSKLDIL